jgi:outer membrane lipopolysaccharide assembly protein LptE/RlpB
MRKRLLEALVTFMLITTAACGYQFRVAGQGPTIGGGGAPITPKADAPTLAIINFQNRSTEPNLETKYTAYTRQEFATASGAQVTTGAGPSDLVLKGQIDRPNAHIYASADNRKPRNGLCQRDH